MRRHAALFVFFLIFAIGTVNTALAKRVALVIANSDYQYAEKLLNPTNDARAIAAAFRRLDFDEVVLKENLDYRNLRLALKDFANKSAGAELAMVYFAGHGIEVSGQNYLIPTDARLESATDIDFEGIPLPSVMSSVEGANNLKLVILDACRNNPFRSRMAVRSGTRSIGRGLAKVEPENNTMVAFAAKEGTVALDGEGEHSPYANALLQVIEEPGVEIGFMFRRVRDLVLKATGQRQEPFTYGSLGGTPIYLKSPEKTADAKETAESEDRIAKLREELDELKRQFNEGRNSDAEAETKSEDIVVAKAEPKTRENTNAKETAERKGSSTQDEFSAPAGSTNAGKQEPTVVASAQPIPTAAEKDANAEPQANPVEPSPTPQLVTDIQQQLARLNCNPGPADGLWGLRTSSAISDLNSESGKKLDASGPQQETLDVLRAMQGPVCKTPAPQIVKPKPVQRTKPKVVRQANPPAVKKKTYPGSNPYAAPRRPSAAPKKKEYWGGEDTRLGCESGAEITEKCF